MTARHLEPLEPEQVEANPNPNPNPNPDPKANPKANPNPNPSPKANPDPDPDPDPDPSPSPDQVEAVSAIFNAAVGTLSAADLTLTLTLTLTLSLTLTLTLTLTLVRTAPGGSSQHEKEVSSEWERATAVSPFWSSSRLKQPSTVPLASCCSRPSTIATPLSPPSMPWPVRRSSPPGCTVGVETLVSRGVPPRSKRRKQPWLVPPTCQQSACRPSLTTYSGSVMKLPSASYASGGGGRLVASTMHLRRRRDGLILALRQRLR